MPGISRKRAGRCQTKTNNNTQSKYKFFHKLHTVNSNAGHENKNKNYCGSKKQQIKAA